MPFRRFTVRSYGPTLRCHPWSSIRRLGDDHLFDRTCHEYFICGMVFGGIGAGINELTALAVTSELAPTAKRGKYVAILILTIIPFCPSVLSGQLIASKSPGAWRWIGLLCGIYNFIGLVLTAVFYFPPPRVNSQGISRRESDKLTGSVERSASPAW